MDRTAAAAIVPKSLSETSLGIIYGNVTSDEFRFAVQAEKVAKGTFVKAKHDIFGWILGHVTAIERQTDLTFLEARNLFSNKESADEYSVNYRKIQDDADRGNVSATVAILGFRDKRNVLQMPTTPLMAGKTIYLAENDFIKSVVGLHASSETGAYMGLLKGHDLKICLDINEMVQKHISVIARTGSGKSYVVGVLIEELLEKEIPIVIIDPHGEYSSLIQPNLNYSDIKYMNDFGIAPRGYASSITEYSIDSENAPGSVPLSFSGMNLDVDEIIKLSGLKRTGSQLGVLHKAIRILSGSTEYYTIKDIIFQAELDRNNAKWNVINAVERLDSHGLFSENPIPLSEIVKKGQCSVINMKGIKPHIQELAVSLLIGSIFQKRKLDTIPPVIVIVEEAHNYCPQKRTVISSDVLMSVASEGRKFGLGLCIVTQRPARIDKNILSQCNTQIILRVTNPNDLKAIITSVEGLTTRAANEIQRLPVGQALVVGANIEIPIYANIRVRKSQHGGKSITIIE